MTEDKDRFLEKLVRLYMAARDLMDGTVGPIRRLIDEGDVAALCPLLHMPERVVPLVVSYAPSEAHKRFATRN
jgi:hypothetical protein